MIFTDWAHNDTICDFVPFKVYESVAFSNVMMLYNHDHHLFLERSHGSRRKPCQSPICFLSLWTCLVHTLPGRAHTVRGPMSDLFHGA